MNIPSTTACRFASALSTAPRFERAVEEVCGPVAHRLGGPPDLAVLFVSADRAMLCDRLAECICRQLGTERLVGCTGEAIVGVTREVEEGPALSLWAARLPDTTVLPMHLTFERTADGPTILGWPDELLEGWPTDAALLVLGEPFSFPAELLLEQINEQHPGSPLFGGMASGGPLPGVNRLLLGSQVLAHGAVVVLLHGAVQVRTVVSQGCRPIGPPYVITKAERNTIFELGGRPALARLQEVFRTLPTHEQEMVQRAVHVGRVVVEYQERFEPGDFLVRNVVCADPESGAIVIGDYVRIGQTVKFHIRDWQTADADLRQLLAGLKATPGVNPGGALLFTCNGRGTRLFPGPHHDAGAVAAALGDIPLAGFFAQGELGPVAGKNFVHGFTASLAVFDGKP